MSSEPIPRAGALYCGEFERFDAMQAEVDSRPFAGELARIVRRARECLKGRTTDQVLAIAELSDYYVSLDVLGGRIIVQHDDGAERPITMETVRDVDERGLLKVVCRTVATMIAETEDGRLDIKACGEFGQVVEINSLTLSDILAVQSLVQCVRAYGEGFMCIVIAAECVTMAELELDHVNISSETTKVVLKASGKNAASARWGWRQQAKARAVEIYLSRTWRDRTQAVKAMKPEIMQLVKRLDGRGLKETNAVNTITKWLRDSGH